MKSIVIDFETRSDVPIEYGVHAYARGKKADILMMAYKVDDQPTKLWFPRFIWHGVTKKLMTPTGALPKELYDPEYRIVAHNADFEATIISTLGRKYDFPEIDYKRFIDTAALCRRYGLPASLEDAGAVMNLQIQKQKHGKELIKMFCVEPFMYEANHACEWDLFCEYCKQDVETTYALWNALPAKTLSPDEEKIWLLTREINERGVPIDIESAEQIYAVTSVFLDENNQRLPKLTNGKVTKVTQVKRIKDWCNERLEEYGIVIDSLGKDKLAELLTMDLPEDVLEVLEIRAGTGLSSIGKYKRMLNMSVDGVMHDNSIYYGAHTGRITGSGFQLLNLPRASVKDPEAEIQKFFDYDILEENPVMSARALIRPMIKAPEGHKLIVSDFSSVEYIAECWLSGDDDAVDKFAGGSDQYKDMAAFLYHIAYEAVTSEERRIGKTLILGCGYGLGPEGFIGYAKRSGLEIDLDTARFAVKGYRDKYKKIKEMWYALNKAAMSAIEFKGEEFVTHRTKFKYIKDHYGTKWLRMTLPSGRNMFYFDPTIEMGKFGLNMTHMGRNQLTKQWERRFVSPGLLTENVIQAMCRDLLYYGKMQLEKAGYKIIGSIYDEVIACVPEDFGSVEEFSKLMSSVPDWAQGLPLRAEGFESKRYRKG